MSSTKLLRINTISEYHNVMNLPKPEHPLISVLKFEEINYQEYKREGSIIHNFYSVALKKNFELKMKYGQNEFDFDAGVLHFMSPKQVLTIDSSSLKELNHSGWLLLIHPDFLWNTPLSKKIKQYEYFTYNVAEALHLSEKEETLITDILEKITQEYRSNIDKLSQDVMIAQIELLLTYSERFYQRQFITRKIANHRILNQLEVLLTEYFGNEHLANQGIPSVHFIADKLNISANYLSRMLQHLTGQSTKHFIQDKLIELAKEKLSTSHASVSEIAYELGFEHSQSFSKLFKSKTHQSPIEFRNSFN